jgi:hypothetical protein
MIKLIISFLILRIYFNTREMEEYNENIKRDLRWIKSEFEELVISIYFLKRNIEILKQELEVNKDIYNAIIKLQDCNFRTYFNKS